MKILEALSTLERSKRHIPYCSNPGDYAEAVEYYAYVPTEGGGKVSTKRRYTSSAAKEVENYLRTHSPVWSQDLSSNMRTGEYHPYKSADWVAAYELPGRKLLVIRGRFHPMHWKSEGGIQLHSHKVVPAKTLGRILEKKAERTEAKSRSLKWAIQGLDTSADTLRNKSERYLR